MPVAAGALEIGDVILLFGAMAALLILWSTHLLTRLLTALLRYVPFVGGWIAEHLMEHVSDALGEAAGWVSGAVGPMVAFLWRPVQWTIALVATIIAGLEAAGGAAYRIVTQAIPAAEHRVMSWAWGIVVDARNAAAALVGQAVDYSRRLFASAIGYVDARVGAAVDYSRSLFASAVGYIDARVGQLERWTVQELIRVEQAATAEFRSLAGVVERDVGALERDIEGAYRAATGYAAEAAAAAEAAGLAAAGAVAVDLERFLRECGRDLCGGLHGLARILQALEPALEGGLLIALAAEAMHDPHGVAREIIDVVGGVAEGTAHELRALIEAA